MLTSPISHRTNTQAFIDLRGNVLKSEDYPESMDTGYLEVTSSWPLKFL